MNKWVFLLDMIFDGLRFAVLIFSFVEEINSCLQYYDRVKLLYELCHKLTKVCFTKRLLWMFQLHNPSINQSIVR